MAGATGWTGKALSFALREDSELKLETSVSRSNSGKDLGEVLENKSWGVPVFADVASALAMAGVLDYAPALSTNLNVDDTGNTFAGVLNGKLRVYIDPYSSMTTAHDFFMAGYKGSSAYDAGMFYCPYVPLQMVRAVGENSFQPKIGFKTRYGLVNNPFATIASGATVSDPYAAGAARKNIYYRIVKVTNLF